jgi:hypothetical protein
MFEQRRFGKFRIGNLRTLKPEDVISDVFSKVFITRCEYLIAEDCFEYTAFSKYFLPVDEACIIPEYAIEITRKGHKSRVRFIMIEGNYWSRECG